MVRLVRLLLLSRTVFQVRSDGDYESAELVRGLALMVHNYVTKLQFLHQENDKTTFKEMRPLEFCQIGIGADSVDLVHLLLSSFQESTFSIFRTSTHFPQEIWDEIMNPFLHRIILHDSFNSYSKICDVVIWGADSELFSLHKIESLYKREKGSEQGSVFVFNTKGCYGENAQAPPGPEEKNLITAKWNTEYCRHLYHHWRDMICGTLPTQFSGCTDAGCVCFAPAVTVIDPHYDGSINCEEFINDLPKGDVNVIDRNSLEWSKPGEIYLGSGQWSQDWFIYQNFFRHYTEPGFYVDVGAMAPFILSNTVAFEYCRNWTGLCIEPNPYVQLSMQVYRSCRLLNVCISGNPKQASQRFAFSKDVSQTRLINNPSAWGYQEGFFENGTFVSDCFSLDVMLEYVGKQQVDYLSVDVEGNEIEVFDNFPFEDFDIRVISVEVNHASSHAIDIILLTQGFVKVAVLGRDAVFVSQKHLKEMPALPWPLTFPPKMRIFPYDEDYRTFQARFRDPAFGND